MKLTKETLKKIIKEELEAVMMEVGESPSEGEIPFVDYQEAKDKSKSGKLPQLYAAANPELLPAHPKPVYFIAKDGDKEYKSVYTKLKPLKEKVAKYQEEGIDLVWYEGSYENVNISPEGLNRMTAAEKANLDYERAHSAAKKAHEKYSDPTGKRVFKPLTATKLTGY